MADQERRWGRFFRLYEIANQPASDADKIKGLRSYLQEGESIDHCAPLSAPIDSFDELRILRLGDWSIAVQIDSLGKLQQASLIDHTSSRTIGIAGCSTSERMGHLNPEP